ncbi:hypothetical protein ABC498_001124 [Salmonella enterica]
MKYLPDILTDLIVATLLAVGIGMNIEGATATAHGLLWVFAIAGILAYLHPDAAGKTAEEYTHRPPVMGRLQPDKRSRLCRHSGVA